MKFDLEVDVDPDGDPRADLEAEDELGASALRAGDQWRDDAPLRDSTPTRRLVQRKGWCQHCFDAPRRSGDGLCRACDDYRRINGRLPAPQLLARRQERRQRAGTLEDWQTRL
jgi:hypothetical protein